MPVYNREAIVKHSINGIIDQSFKDWELIIVDDGSTDNTVLECGKFARNDERIKIYAVPHSGHIGKVRNIGNKLAKGELIVVQDSDDVSLPDRLDVLWQEYQNTNADVLYHAMYMLFRDAELDMISRQFRAATPYDKKLLFHTQYIPGQLAYKRQVILKTPYNEDVTVSDDWILLLELALKNYKFHHIQRGLYEYWYVPDSVTLNSLKDGKRATDMKIIKSILWKKYKIKVTDAVNIHQDRKTGKILKYEKIK